MEPKATTKTVYARKTLRGNLRRHSFFLIILVVIQAQRLKKLGLGGLGVVGLGDFFGGAFRFRAAGLEGFKVYGLRVWSRLGCRV